MILTAAGVKELEAFEAIKRTIVTTVGFSFFGQDIRKLYHMSQHYAEADALSTQPSVHGRRLRQH
jgi:hypothetical protein